MDTNKTTNYVLQIIINPSSRSGRGQAALHTLLQQQSAFRRVSCRESRSPSHFCELVQAAQESHTDAPAVAIAGGDGTVTLALSALQAMATPQRLPLLVLPTGSGNDFVHDLTGSRRLSAALALLHSGQRRFIDVGEARSQGVAAQPFCCVASVGLDELALRHIHGSRLPRSQALNLYAALRGLLQYRPRTVAITWQGGAYEGEIMFCAVTNTRSYGGGFRVSPAARLDDGLLDLCIVPRMPKAQLLWHFPRILRGTHGHLPGLVMAQSPWVQIAALPSALTELPLCLDGELPISGTPVALHCLPRRLEVLAPAVHPAQSSDEKKEAT